MRIDKEEKRSLKKLFVGILVMALLVTMVPIENHGYIVTKADVIVPEDNVFVVDAKTVDDENGKPIFSVEEVVIQEFKKYASNPEIYSNGLVINVYSDLDLSKMSLESAIFPKDIYFVLKNDCNLYACWDFFSKFKVADCLNVNVLGTGTIYPMSKEFVGDGETNDKYINNWYLGYGMNVRVSSTVDTSEVRFCVEQGASLTLDGKNRKIDNTMNMDKYCVYYYSDVIGLFKVEEESIYVEEIGREMIQDGILNLDTFHMEIMGEGVPSRIIYTKSAIDSIPENTRLLYFNNCFGAYYDMPSEEFIVDTQYGIYNVSDDRKKMTIYALYNSYNVTEFDVESDSIEIVGNFVTTYDDGTSVQCTEVNFADGAIRDNYTYYVESTEITESFHSVKIYQREDEPLSVEQNFNFDLASVKDKVKETQINPDEIDPDPFYIFNRTATGVMLKNHGDISVYVPANVIEIDHVTVSTLNEQWEVGGDSYYYVKAGDTLILTPDEGYTIYDVQLGYGQGIDYDYKYGRRAPMENVRFGTNGIVEITVPNFAWDLEVTVETMEKMDVTEVTITPECSLFDGESQTYWHGAPFGISKENHDVVLVETENGKSRYYIIDKTVELDSQDIDRDGSIIDYVASSTYGKIAYLDYKFVLDTAPPTITSVTANLKEISIPLKSGDILWINEPSVTLEATASEGNGLPVVEYKYGSGAWQTENTFTIFGDGMHHVEFHARDEFDVKLEHAGKPARAEIGVWKGVVGIDITAPTLLYMDANNVEYTRLKTNTEYEGNLYLRFHDGSSGFGEFVVYEKNGQSWIQNSKNLVETTDGVYIKPVATDVTYRMQIADAAGNEVIYDNIIVKAIEQEVTPTPPTEEPTKPEEKPVPPAEKPAPEETAPVLIGSGRVHLDAGTAYILGEGTWKVNGDNTIYAGGSTFYVPESGEYEFSQQ